MKQVLFVHSPHFESNVYPGSCPFNSGRAEKVRAIISGMGMLSPEQIIHAEPATREELEWFHQSAYLDALEQAAKGDLAIEGLQMGLGSGDCPVFPEVYSHGAKVAGASIAGARKLAEGAAKTVFNLNGGLHHAMSARASGFCYINDVVLACEALRRVGKRVFFLDVDAHHGDGVQTAFYKSREVFTLSFHQDPRTLFPGTGLASEIGEGEGLGFAANCPLPPGVYDEAFLLAFNEVALPLISAFAPDVIVAEFGMDGLAGDPLTGMQLTNNAYAAVAEAIQALDKPLMILGGGGYNFENTTRGWALIWSILSGAVTEHDPTLGLGGVMLGSTEWGGGLRDRVLNPPASLRDGVSEAVSESIGQVKEGLFSLHGLLAR